jgi:hypothetical protein
MIKLITMVKDEVDIVEDWIIYHGNIFGFNNIYVIDNYSIDGTYEILLKFASLINISRKKNYSSKGIYMRSYIDKYCSREEFGYPLDIDEFIVYYDYDTKKILIDKEIILNYFKNLPDYKIYKTAYIMSSYTNEDVVDYPDGFMRATIESKYGCICDFNPMTKSFIKKKLYDGPIDMGNHLSSNNYYKTNLCLIHFHSRNLDQMKKKILSNILGLGYTNDLNFLIKKEKNKQSKGIHHIRSQIAVLQNQYNLYIYDKLQTNIDLSVFNKYILEITNNVSSNNYIKELEETVDIETVDIETVDIETVDIETVDIETVDIETVDIETVDIETIDIETVNIETVNIETIDIETVDIKQLNKKKNARKNLLKKIIYNKKC